MPRTLSHRTNGELSKAESADAVRLVTRLMAISGRSGQEGKVLATIRSLLQRGGIPRSLLVDDGANRRSPIGGEAGNLVVKLPGTHRGPRRVLMAHVDTVPLCEGSVPVRKGARIVSGNPKSALGADDRAGAGVLVHTLLTLHKRKLPHPPLTFLWLVQEEVGLLGARHVDLKKLGKPELSFNWDGGSSDVATIGATGGAEMQIEVTGQASHAGVCPERGISAVAIAARAIDEIVKGGWHGLVVKGASTGTSNIGVIDGGEATNVVTPQLILRAEARSHDPGFRDRILQAYRRAFETAVAGIKNDVGGRGSFAIEVQIKYEAFRIPENSPAVLAAQAAIGALGLAPSTRVSNGGLDANWMTLHGLPTVTLGCGQQDVHTVNESLDIPGFLNACRIARLLATGADGAL